MMSNYESNEILKIVVAGISTIGVLALVVFLMRSKKKYSVTGRHCVFITGCDSGLGHTIALQCYQLGFFVVAGCLDAQSGGAKKLLAIDNSRMVVTEIDIGSDDSINAAIEFVHKLVNRNGMIFSALVNNAGIMAFGEFEWQTFTMIENQIQINLIGTMKLTKSFLPMCRKHNARVIIVTSHCSLQALPGLATYTASKAGLRFFIDSLRVEMKKYHVDIINFIPGSFILKSNIFARQLDYVLEMERQMTEEQRHDYRPYFNDYNNYLVSISQYRTQGPIEDTAMLLLFERALLEINPKSVYKNENLRYAVYHFVCGVSPVFIRDWLIVRFMQMPEYKPAVQYNEIN